MTLDTLSRHYKLREQLKKDLDILESLKSAAFPASPKLDDMPHGQEVSDKVGDLAIEIADMEERIRYLREAISEEEKSVSGWIANIENDQTRMIFRLRFIRCLTWAQVAMVVGGRNTDAGVKMVCYRYLGAQPPESGSAL